MTAPARQEPESAPRGAQLATYGAGFFSIGLQPMFAVLIPLWSLHLGATPALIGVAVGVRSLLPALLSIHAGALMDRFGVRRVTIAAAACAALALPLYPLLASMPAVILLQAIEGLAQAVAWIGAQTRIAQMSRGAPQQAGRFGFAAGAGTFLGPLIGGWSWDRFGPAATFGFATLWCLALLACALRLPGRRPATAQGGPPRMDWRDLLPRMSDYRAAIALLAVPAIALVIGGTVLRMSALGIHQSLYPVYLESVGFTGTMIGGLISAAWLVSAAAAFLAAPATRRVGAAFAFALSIAVAIAAIAITPVFAELLPLALAASVFGTAIGLAEPLVVTLVARGAEGDRQGMSFGLRGTANRVAALIVPIAMGAIADLFGVAESFFIVGGVLLSLSGALALRARGANVA